MADSKSASIAIVYTASPRASSLTTLNRTAKTPSSTKSAFSGLTETVKSSGRRTVSVVMIFRPLSFLLSARGNTSSRLSRRATYRPMRVNCPDSSLAVRSSWPVVPLGVPAFALADNCTIETLGLFYRRLSLSLSLSLFCFMRPHSDCLTAFKGTVSAACSGLSSCAASHLSFTLLTYE